MHDIKDYGCTGNKRRQFGSLITFLKISLVFLATSNAYVRNDVFVKRTALDMRQWDFYKKKRTILVNPCHRCSESEN